MNPTTVYGRRQRAYEALQTEQRRAADRLSNLRLLSVIVGFALSYVVYRTASHGMGFALGFLTCVLFGYLALQHHRVVRQLRYAEALSGINQKGGDRSTGRWAAFADTGVEFRDEEHPYASDLDLFGQGSLFQWISSAQTALGREALARLLKQAPGSVGQIVARQAAVTELGRRLAWRQWFEAEGLVIRDRLQPAEPLVRWAEESDPVYLQPWVRLGIRILPVITILMLALSAVHWVPWTVSVVFVILQGLLLRIHGKERSRVLSMVHRFESGLRTYSRMLARLESRRFDAPWLTAQQERLRDAAGRPAYEQIRRLSAIAERISNRHNAMFMLVNILTLWDYQCMVELERWKQESGRLLGTWLQVLGEVEALSSLANIRFEHPDWGMPTVTGDSGGLSAQRMGHPLITRNRICNDFDLNEPARIAVITGSNMSGKSTFLRTVGINLVLAYSGAPVCAEAFRCSVMRLWTSMRVADNLEQNISSFYAELLRIKRVVAAARAGERVCFLLDEIFKGTNSHDRHQGARALIRQLQKQGAYGLISTHDLELGELQKESHGRIRNYHFREYYEGEAIRFDYTLRTGISTTRNALYLIRLVGIDLD